MPDHKDAVLKQVRAAIEHEAHLDMQGSPIAMDFKAGTLRLSGEVANVGTKQLALRAAGAVAGVTAIVDALHVNAGPARGDGATRDAVCDWLLGNINFQNCTVHAWVKGQRKTLRDAGSSPSGVIEVAVADGIVTLRGHVISLSHKRLAGVLAWWARGCRDLVDELAVVPPEEDNDEEITEALHLVFESDPYLHTDHIDIGSANHVVTLAGTVASAGKRARAEQDAWCLFAVDHVVNRIEVR